MFLTQFPFLRLKTIVMVHFMSTELGYGSQLCSQTLDVAGEVFCRGDRISDFK